MIYLTLRLLSLISHNANSINGKTLNDDMCMLKLVSLFMISEKSGNGHEEGQCKGPILDDIGFAGPFHFPLYLGILHLVIEMGPFQCALCVYMKTDPGLRRYKINGTCYVAICLLIKWNTSLVSLRQ